MKFLADENFPRPAVLALRRLGFHMEWVGEDFSGASDEEVLERCGAKSLTLITLDKDFGELAFHKGVAAESGVVLVRMDPKSPEEVASVVAQALRTREDWSGNFSVVTPKRIRMTRLPRARTERPGKA